MPIYMTTAHSEGVWEDRSGDIFICSRMIQFWWNHYHATFYCKHKICIHLTNGQKKGSKTNIDVVGYIQRSQILSKEGIVRKQADRIGTLRNYVCIRMDMTTILELLRTLSWSLSYVA